MLDKLVLSYIHLTSVINYQFHSFTTSYSSFVALSGFSGFFFDFLIYLIFRHIKSHVDKVFEIHSVFATEWELFWSVCNDILESMYIRGIYVM